MTAIVFPGQGSQKPGMSKDFYENFRIAKDTFDEIEDNHLSLIDSPNAKNLHKLAILTRVQSVLVLQGCGQE